jgi:hypothetical protein
MARLPHDREGELSPPAIIIRFELEAAPRVLAICEHDGDERRLWDWLVSNPHHVAIVTQALELEREGRKA